MENNEVKKLKNRKKWAVLILILLIFVVTVILFSSYSFDDSGRSLIAYIEQGIVIVCALVSGFISYRSAINSQINDIESEEKNNQLRIELQNRDDNIRDEQKQFEEKWNQKKIDANLKAKARIEWIQNVRVASSRFVSASYGLIRIFDKADKSKLREQYYYAKETSFLLILYFGTDTETLDNSNNSNHSNKGKNNEIVGLIEKIIEVLDECFEDLMNDIYCKEVRYLECEKKDAFSQIPTHSELMFDSEGEEYTIDEPDFNSDEAIEYNRINNELILFKQKYKQRFDDLETNLLMLIQLIRTYLKIEWDRAKNNED